MSAPDVTSQRARQAAGCPTCGAPAGKACRGLSGRQLRAVHMARIRRAEHLAHHQQKEHA